MNRILNAIEVEKNLEAEAILGVVPNSSYVETPIDSGIFEHDLVLSMLDEKYIQWIGSESWNVRRNVLTDEMRRLVRQELIWFADAPARRRRNQRVRELNAYYGRTAVCSEENTPAACSQYRPGRGIHPLLLPAPEIPTCNRDGSPILPPERP
jgi:hypothetical protein